MAYTIEFRSMSDEERRVVRRVLVWSASVLGVCLALLGAVILALEGYLGSAARGHVNTAKWLDVPILLVLGVGLLALEVVLFCCRRYYIHRKVLKGQVPTLNGVFLTVMIFLGILGLLLLGALSSFR